MASMGTVAVLTLVLLILASVSCKDPFDLFDLDEEEGDECCTKVEHYKQILKQYSSMHARCRRQLLWRSRQMGQKFCKWREKPEKSADISAESVASVESAFMRRHVMRTLRLLHLDSPDVPPLASETFCLHLTVSEYQVSRLRDFQAGGHVPLIEVDDILTLMLEKGDLESVASEGLPRWARRFSFVLRFEFWYFMLCSVPAVWLVWSLFMGRSWGYILCGVFLFTLVVSTVWHWQHMYSRALAERHLAALQDVPRHCRPEEGSWYDGLMYFVRASVSFTPHKADCKKYAEFLIVSPFEEVTPTMAFAETCSRLLFIPLEHLGQSLGKFYAGLAQHVPTLWMLPLTVASLVFVFCLVLIACGYQFWGIKPTRRQSTVSEEPRHVLIAPGLSEVRLIVTSDGRVRTLGAAAATRVSVLEPGELPRPGSRGWFSWLPSLGLRSRSQPALQILDSGGSGDATGQGISQQEQQKPQRGSFSGGQSADSQAGGDYSEQGCPEIKPTWRAVKSTVRRDQSSQSLPVRLPTGAGDNAQSADGPASAVDGVTSDLGSKDEGAGSPGADCEPGRGEDSAEGPESPFLTKIRQVMNESVEDIDMA